MVRRVRVEVLNFCTWILGEPLVVCDCLVQSFKHQTTVAVTFLSEFLPYKSQIL